MDVKIVDGRHLDNRKYITLMRSQDRSLAEMAVNAGGSLALTAHNIHVVPSDTPRNVVIRDSYTTRRKEKIERASFDTTKAYTLIPRKPARVVMVSSSSDTDESNNNQDDDDQSSDDFIKIQKRSPKSPIKLKAGGVKQLEEFSFSSSSLSEDFTIRKDSKILQQCCSQDESLINEISKELKDEADLEVLLEKWGGFNDAHDSWVKDEPMSRTSSLETNRIKMDSLLEKLDGINDEDNPWIKDEVESRTSSLEYRRLTNNDRINEVFNDFHSGIDFSNPSDIDI